MSSLSMGSVEVLLWLGGSRKRKLRKKTVQNAGLRYFVYITVWRTVTYLATYKMTCKQTRKQQPLLDEYMRCWPSVRSRWLVISQFFFLFGVFIDRELKDVEVNKWTRRENPERSLSPYEVTICFFVPARGIGHIITCIRRFAVRVVQNRHAREEGTHWDKRNNELTSFKMVFFFVVFSKFLSCSLVWRFCTTWMTC